jgi:hypothetical protein
MARLTTLPIEVQLMIAHRVNEDDVLALNATSRALHLLVQPLIASIFSTHRTFNFSEVGMAELLTLSRRPSWAPHLGTLIISHDGIIQPASCHEVLLQALRNLGAYGKLSSLGVSLAQYQGSSVYVKSFLEKTLTSASGAGLAVSNVIFQLGVDPDFHDQGIQRRAWAQPSPAQDEFVAEVTEVWTIMRSLNTMSFPGVGRGFSFSRKGFESTRKSALVTYHPQKHSLVGLRLLADDFKLLARWFPVSVLLKVEVIKLSECAIELWAIHELFIKRSLKVLSIENVTLVRDRNMTGPRRFAHPPAPPFGRRPSGWQGVFHDLLADSPNLSICRLGPLQFGWSTFTGAIWEASGTEDVQEMLQDLRWGKRSRMIYKKENAPYSSEPRKPRKKAPRSRKTHFTHKKSRKNKN